MCRRLYFKLGFESVVVIWTRRMYTMSCYHRPASRHVTDLLLSQTARWKDTIYWRHLEVRMSMEDYSNSTNWRHAATMRSRGIIWDSPFGEDGARTGLFSAGMLGINFC